MVLLMKRPEECSSTCGRIGNRPGILLRRWTGRRGRVDLSLEHGLAVLVAAGYSSLVGPSAYEASRTNPNNFNPNILASQMDSL